MQKVIVIVGLPGSGKSTLARFFLKQGENCVIIEADALRFAHKEKPTHSQKENQQVFDLVHKRMREHLAKGKTVVIDATNVSKRSRKEYLHIAKKCGVPIEAVFVNTPLPVCIEQNKGRGARTVPESVICAMAERLTPPTIEEGFTTIHAIEGGKRLGERSIFNW